MPARKKSAECSDSLNFEDALANIEKIVESMENEQLPLEDLVTQYEKGSVLLKHCENVLSSARKRIELITLANREDSGQETARPSSTLSTNTPPQNDGVPDDDPNDISLF